MKLQILIAQYRENEAMIYPLLQSIGLQQAINFDDVEVIICNDGSDVVLSDDFLNQFSYNIRYIKNKHGGVSVTRNTLLDAASAEYIMLCDADDCFINMFALYMIFQGMDKGFDVFVATFVEDVCIQERHMYVNRHKDPHFIHGKVFRRQYLIDNNIRWKDRFTFSGDTYFLTLALNSGGKLMYYSTPIYMWRWNDNSICRHERNHFARAYSVKMDVDCALIEEFIARGQTENAQKVMADFVYDAYFSMLAPSWSMLRKEDRQAKEAQFRSIFSRYKQYFYDASPEIKSGVVANKRASLAINGIFEQPVSFDNWIKSVTD